MTEIIVLTLTALALIYSFCGLIYYGALLLHDLYEHLFDLFVRFMDYLAGVNNK